MSDKSQTTEKIEGDIAGVQGRDERDDSFLERIQTPGEAGAQVQAPDAGEIEWAGAIVKKAPRAKE